MTDLQKYLLFGLDYTWLRLHESYEGLTDEQMKWRPTNESNSAGAILLHIARMNDSMANRRFLKQPQLWDKEGGDWKTKLNFPNPAGGAASENGWTFDHIPLSENKITKHQIEEYFLAARERVKKAILESSPELLAVPVNDGNSHHAGWTNQSWLEHIPLHESHHQGQLDYVAGLCKAMTKATVKA